MDLLQISFNILLFLGTVLAAKQFRCDYKYIREIDGWLKYHEIPSNWNNARLRCQMEGATLASPLTLALKSAMVDTLRHQNFTVASFTGIHAMLSKGDFMSVEGIPLSQIPHVWTQNEPNNLNDNEDCLVMLPGDGSLADAPCTSTYNYFCYKEKANLVVTSCGTTDPEYTLDARTQKCYKFHKVPNKWSKALMHCMAEGGYLTIINSETEAQVIREIFAKNPAAAMLGNFVKDYALVGFQDWNQHGEWRSIQGQTVEEAGYKTFVGGEPNNAGTGEHCGAINRNAHYMDLPCDTIYPFICEKEPAFTKNFRCDYKYIPALEGWLKYHEIPSKWNDARLWCQMEGAVLASPLTPVLKTAMVDTLKQKKITCGAFTGIHSTFSKGAYASIEGVTLNRIPHTWAENEPDNFNDGENCLVMLPGDGALADTNCTDAFPFFCYKKKANLILNNCGTIDNQYTYDSRTGHCYKFHKEPRTWAKAYMNCMAEGAYLAVINNDTEAQVIRELFGKNPSGIMIGNFWKDVASIGFHDWQEHGEWRTVLGETIEEAGYKTFAGGEPNNAGTGEHCGAINRNVQLYDLPCETIYAFICEKEPGSLACDDDSDDQSSTGCPDNLKTTGST